MTSGHSVSGSGLEIYEAHIKYGYILKEVADQLQTYYTTVNKVLAEEEKKQKRYFKT